MTGAMATLRALLERAARNWPNKLLALLIAFVVWLFVTESSTTTTQTSMFVPLVVEGIDDDQVAVGLPTRVAVSVSGPSTRIQRLTEDSLRATLDLTDVTGAFEVPITVQAPQQVAVETVDPTQVIGFLESVDSRSFPVQVALTGSLPADSSVTASASPPSLVLTGRSQVLESVRRVVVTAPANGGGEAVPVALDALGAPVTEVTFEPATVTVTVATRPVLSTKTVTVDLIAPTAPNLVAVDLSSPTVEVAGSQAALATLETVTATVDPPTGTVDPGRYTLPVRLALPEGVVALSTPTAALQFVRDPLQP